MQSLNDWHRSSERQSVKNTSCSKTQRVKHFFQKRKERHSKESDEGQFHHRDVERFYQREFVIKGFVWDAVIYEENCENRRLATEESIHTRQNFSQLNSLETFREKSAFRIRSRAQRYKKEESIDGSGAWDRQKCQMQKQEIGKLRPDIGRQAVMMSAKFRLCQRGKVAAVAIKDTRVGRRLMSPISWKPSPSNYPEFKAPTNLYKFAAPDQETILV